MAKKVPVGHWECEYCGAQFLTKTEATIHMENCEYSYDMYN